MLVCIFSYKTKKLVNYVCALIGPSVCYDGVRDQLKKPGTYMHGVFKLCISLHTMLEMCVYAYIYTYVYI